MPGNIPLFKSNLNVDTAGQGIVTATGQRAVADNFNQVAGFFGDISNHATEVFGQQQVDAVRRGEVSEEDLPDPVTVIGQKMRNAFAEKSAIETSISISNKIQEIAGDDSLSSVEKEQLLVASSQNMVNANIPEMAESINSSFLRSGVPALNNAANKRLAGQRAVQLEGQKALQGQVSDSYNRAFVSGSGAKFAIDELASRLADGDITSDEYIQEFSKIDTSSFEALSVARSNLVGAVESRVSSGGISRQMGDVILSDVERSANMDSMIFRAVAAGGDYSVFDEGEFSVDELSSMYQKTANMIGISNNASDRADRLEGEEITRNNNSVIQVSQNSAISGDYQSGYSILNDLAKRNELLGDSSLTKQIENTRNFIDDIAGAGGVANPALFEYYKREVQLGRFNTIEDIYSDLKRTGGNLNQDEYSELRQVADDFTDSVFSDRSNVGLLGSLKLRLPDDSNKVSLIGEMRGERETVLQRAVEKARGNIELGYIDGINNGSLKTTQQIQAYFNEEITKAKKVIRRSSLKSFRVLGLSLDSSDTDIMDAVTRAFPVSVGVGASDASRSKFTELVKLRDDIEGYLDE